MKFISKDIVYPENENKEWVKNKYNKYYFNIKNIIILHKQINISIYNQKVFKKVNTSNIFDVQTNYFIIKVIDLM